MGRPTQHNHPPRPVRPPGEGQNDTRPLCDTRIPHPPRGGRMIRPGKRGGGHSGRDTPGLFPFRTRKLRLPAPMVLHPPGCGRVGHRRLHTTRGARHGPPFFSRTHTPPHGHTAPHTHTAGHAPARPHVRGHTAPHTHTGHTTKFATPATVNTTVRGHTATRTPKTTHTTKFATPHRIFEHRFWARAFVWADGVERGWACVGLLTASRALSALFAAEPLVSQSLEGPLSGRGSGSVVRVLTRV